MILLSFYYKRNISFHEDYYYNRHIPLVKNEVFEMGALKLEVKKFPASAPYQCSFSLYFPTQSQLDAFLANPRLKALQDDVANYYAESPDVFVEELTIQEEKQV